MPRSSRRRSRKHDGYYREERDRSDSDEDSREREQEERKGSARASKGSEQHEERVLSASVKVPDAGDASGSSTEGQKKRKGRDEQEAVAGDDRWSAGAGGGEDDDCGNYDLKRSRNSYGIAKGKSTRKFDESDRSNDVGRRKSDRGVLFEEDSLAEHYQVKEGAREHRADKSKDSKQVVVLKEENMDQQYKTVKDRSREHRAEKGNESRYDASQKVMPRNEEVKTRDSEGVRVRKCNGTDADRQFQDELHDGELEKNGRHRKTKDQPAGKDDSQSGSRDRQSMSTDGHNKNYEQHRDEEFKDEMSRGVEKRRERKYTDERSKPEDKHKGSRYKDDRHKEEERHRDERYRVERLRNEDRHRDGKYKEERSKYHKDEMYKEKYRNVEKPRNERSDGYSREKHRDDTYRNHRHQDGRSWDTRSSKDDNRDRSMEKYYKEEHSYSESRHSKNRLHDNEGDIIIDHRSSKYRDDNKGKKRSYEESLDRDAKEHGEGRSEVGSFVSSVDRRWEYVIQDKVDSQRRNYEKKSPTKSSTYPVREQTRHFPKQEVSPPKECSTTSGRHNRTSDFQLVEGQSKTDANMNESSLASKDGRNLRSDGRPVRADRSLSTSDRQVLNRSNLRHSHDNADNLLKKGNARHHELPLIRQAAENYQSASPRNIPPPPEGYEMDAQRSFEEDNRIHIREHRSSSRSRRSGTVDNARGHGNTWNNPSSWHSPVHNGFGPFQHGHPIPGFHPAMQQFPFFGMRPSMDMNHIGVPFPLHEHPESFPRRGQPFSWHSSVEDPYLPRLPGGNANVFEECSHGYDRQELGRNKDLEFEQQSEVPFLAHGTSDKPSSTQFPDEIQSEQYRAESSAVKTVDGANAQKTGAQAPKYISEREPGPSTVKVDNSQFRVNYLKRIDISRNLASTELYKQCVTMVSPLDLTQSCKLDMLRSFQNKKHEHGCQAKVSEYVVKSMFPGKKTSIFENAMALYRSSIGSEKYKIFASTAHPESEGVIQQASVDMVGEGSVAAREDQSLPTMRNDVKNNDQPRDGVDLNMHGEYGLAKECSNRDEDKVIPHTVDKNLSIDHGDGRACYTEQQSSNNGEGELPGDTSLTNVTKSGVISDAAFASSSQTCEDVMPGCRVNLKRIPCSPGST